MNRLFSENTLLSYETGDSYEESPVSYDTVFQNRNCRNVKKRLSALHTPYQKATYCAFDSRVLFWAAYGSLAGKQIPEYI